MSHFIQSNAILGRLGPECRTRLLRHLQPVSFSVDDVLISPGQVIDQIFFVEKGLTSVVSEGDGRQSEVAMIGPEGLVGYSALLGVYSTPQKTLVQIGGRAQRIPTADLCREAEQMPELQQALMFFVNDMMLQISDSCFANAQQTVEVRLARWLLMASDRLGAADIPLTHDRIATMLGCRRAGVTMSMHLLEGERTIRATRGRIQIQDRGKLEQIAGSAYKRSVSRASENGTASTTSPAAQVIS
ncbi:MAG: cAMP-binding protein [Hyphomicrobiales bacterium]|nr:cAMP-binding protein [Hyphomicrobiales bacterium]